MPASHIPHNSLGFRAIHNGGCMIQMRQIPTQRPAASVWNGLWRYASKYQGRLLCNVYWWAFASGIGALRCVPVSLPAAAAAFLRAWEYHVMDGAIGLCIKTLSVGFKTLESLSLYPCYHYSGSNSFYNWGTQRELFYRRCICTYDDRQIGNIEYIEDDQDYFSIRGW